MANVDRLVLSALKTSLPCSLDNKVSDKRCLIHVKLTEFCMKTVEHLIDNEKGAFFSLWFDESGGRMSIPVEQGDSRIFQFKTAPLREGEGQGSLECVHQALASSQDHLLSCWGVMEHRLTVQGTDEVYLRTKQQMEIAEKLRKEQRTQPIKVPQPLSCRTKAKALQPLERISPVPPTVRKPNRPKPPPPSYSKSTAVPGNKGPVLLQDKTSYPPQPKLLVTSSDPKLKSSSRSTYTLKERVIHMLALMPHTREQIVNRLKKATKRSETAMSNLDSTLQEVSEVSQGTYKLKPRFLLNLDVDQWPFYTDAQKTMLKRSKIREDSMPDDLAAVKRPDSEKQYDIASKKPKLSPPFTETTVTFSEAGHAQDDVLHPSSDTCSHMTPPDKISHHGKKKKKKKKKDDVEVIANDPTSTTSTPDHLSQFPTLTCEEERQRYKQIFNKEYVDYLKLKDSIDQVADQNQKECSALSERLNSVPKHSVEYKEAKKLIQEKYREFQRNRSYLENKNKFDELHQKLNHIKQMVLQYDALKK